MNELPNQNDKPATVFIFGAGACYPDGVPLQRDLIPLILEERDPQLKKSQVSKKIRAFLTKNFSHGGQYPSLEEVFGFINFFVANDMSLSRDWGKSDLLQLKADLTKVLHYLISKRTGQSNTFSRFWKVVREIDPNIGIITTNYDTLMDEAFDGIYPDCLLDYCLELVNYRSPEALDAFNWWVDPKKPTRVFNGVIPTRIKLVKLHGSLNWKYCDCCGQVALTPWQHQIDLKLDSYQGFVDSYISDCPFDGNRLSSLIQVPTHIRANNNYIFHKLYDEATFLVGNAKKLVFIGYSFPEADVHIRALVRKSFAEDGEIIVINKSRAKDLRHRYEALAKDVDYFETPFEQFVNSRRFRKILEANKALQPTPRYAVRG